MKNIHLDNFPNKHERTKKIYICSTYYHVLIALVRSIHELSQWDILITDYILDGANLATRLTKQNIFAQVFHVAEMHEYKSPNLWDRIFYFHQKNRARIESQLPLDLLHYQEIIIFHDDIWISHYLKEMKIHYTLLEDSLNCFSLIDQSPFAHLIPRLSWKRLIKKITHMGYLYFQDCDCIDFIEVNSIENLKLKKDHKILVRPRQEMFNCLTAKEKSMIFQVFIDSFSIDCKNNTLLLTQPLFDDHLVSSLEEQKRVYRHILDQYTSSQDLIFVKPHPRDTCHYPNTIMLNKNFPIEILNFQGEILFNRGITLFSTALSTLDCVENKIFLGSEALKNIIKEV